VNKGCLSLICAFILLFITGMSTPPMSGFPVCAHVIMLLLIGGSSVIVLGIVLSWLTKINKSITYLISLLFVIIIVFITRPLRPYKYVMFANQNTEKMIEGKHWRPCHYTITTNRCNKRGTKAKRGISPAHCVISTNSTPNNHP